MLVKAIYKQNLEYIISLHSNLSLTTNFNTIFSNFSLDFLTKNSLSIQHELC